MTEKPGMSTKLIADAGIFAALSIVLILIAWYVPILGFFVTFVCAVPLMIVVMRHHWWAGVLTGIIVFSGAMVLVGPMNGIVSALTVVGYGLTYGLCFKNQVSPAKTLFLGTVITGFLAGATLVIMAILGNVPLSAFITDLEKTMEQVFATYESMGVLDRLLPAGMTVAEYKDSIMALFSLLLPAVLIIGAMITAAANYLFAGMILKKLRFSLRTLPPFREWHIPWWMVWGVIIALGAQFLSGRLENEILSTLAQNLFYIYFPITAISGLALLAFMFHQFRISRNVQIFLWIVFVVFLTFTLPFTLFLGLFDMIIDYRKIFAGMKNKNDMKDK